MKRNEFLKTSAILSEASLLPVNTVFSNNLNENGMDKLVNHLCRISAEFAISLSATRWYCSSTNLILDQYPFFV